MTGKTNSPDEVYIDVNGERWYRNVNISEDSGTYTHPYLLPEGKNTVAFGARFYGKRPGSTNITIDNLKVIYLEKEESMINSDKNGLRAERIQQKIVLLRQRQQMQMLRTAMLFLNFAK